MKKSVKQVLSFLLALVLVLGLFPVSAFAEEAQTASNAALPTAMEGLSIAYPYNTETVQLTGTPADRFDALTFESARGEVESAQMILTPSFAVESFELTMSSLKNEKGNIIPSWAFEVFVQHYVTVSGSGNAANYSSSYNMYNPTYNTEGYDGTFPDALIPQDAAIAKGENKIAAGNNQGIWVNLNVQNAAPGTYTGSATLTVNGSAMQIPVSVHVYDVAITEEVHATNFIAIWWDMVQAAEGGIDRELADAYFDYLLTKRITPMEAWNVNRWDNTMASAITGWAQDPRITSYLIQHQKGSDGVFDAEAMKTTLTTLINKQLEVGGGVDLFAKGYFYIYDEPRDDEEYAISNQITAQLDSIKAELAPMLAAYPSIQQSFLDLKQVVTAPNPTDKTYSKVGNFWNYFINDDYGSTVLTGDSYVYVPQYQWFQNADQRALYANEEEVWWYGCCHPIAPYPTYHLNTPLVSARVESWMRYAYGIDGFLYSSVNIWGNYTDSGIAMFDFWNSYSKNGTPGDQILLYPGSPYGVEGPIGSIRMENIREGQEDYEYLWQLENVYGADISAYTANLYSGVIPDTDASIHYNNRKALLTKLEQLNVAANGATNIAPGQEGFNRGQKVDASASPTIQMDETVNAQAVTFDYKIVSGNKFGFVLMPDWSNFYGYFDFNASGAVSAYNGVTCIPLDDGYIRVVIDLNAVTTVAGSPTNHIDFMWVNSGRGNAVYYMDDLQVLTEVPEIEIPSEPPVTEPTEPETEPPTEAPTEPPVVELPTVFEGGAFAAGTGATLVLDNTQSVVSMSFDYKIDSGEKFDLALMPNWSSYFGYFSFNANGTVTNYNGVSSEKLADGSIRVFVDMTKVTAKVAEPSDVLTMFFIRGNTTTATGNISNICINESAAVASRGTALTPGTNQSITVGAKEEIGLLSFDYKVTSGEKIAMALMPNWSSYYGYYEFTAQGANGNYVGVTTELLEDGYIRVTYDMAALNKLAGSPTAVIGFLFLNGSYCTANGFIDNVQYVLKKDMPRGTELTPGVNQSISVGAKENVTTLSFDYKITGGEKIAMALMPNWSSYYGYYEFTAQGANGNYVGVTTELLEDGYIRVTYDMAALDKLAGTPSAVIDFLFINGGYSTANGYIDNVQYTTHTHKYEAVVTEPDCLNGGFTTHTCSCGDSYVDTQVDALGHNYESVVTAPTPEAQGFTTHTCSRCGDSYVDSYTDYVPESPYMVLEGDMTVNLSLDKDLYVNLNGFDMTGTIITNGYKVYGIDATTDGYTCEEIGYFNCVDSEGNAVVPELHHKSEMTGAIKRYLTIETQEGYSFHRIYTGITHKSLRPGATGVGYKAIFGGDEMVHSQLDAASGFGYSLWLNKDNVVSRGTKSSAFVPGSDGNVLTLVLKNFDVTNYGEAPVYATVWMKLADGTVIESAEYSYTMRSLIEQINDNYTLLSETQLTAVRDLIEREPVMQDWSVENLYQKEVIRGEAIEAGVNKVIEFKNTEVLETVSFEYKVVDGERFNLALMKDWSSFYSYYAFNATGAIENYAGVTTETLEDGYIRVTIQVAELNKVNGSPDGVIDFLYIRGDWSDADGYIDNVNYTVYKPTLNFEGAAFAANTGATIELKGEKSNDLAVSRMTFDYTIENDGYFHIALMPNWNSFYGYFKFDVNGVVGTYAGIVSKKLDNSTVRVYVDMSKLTAVTGAPSNVITMLYIRGDWTTANGTISNICINEAAEIAPRGETFEAGVNKTINPANLGELATISFEYKIETGNKFALALMPNWSSFYGYFDFNAAGTNTYNGVTLEALEDGYIRVTFDMDALTKVGGTPTTAIDFLYIRGDWTDATGYIDNVQFTKK